MRLFTITFVFALSLSVCAQPFIIVGDSALCFNPSVKTITMKNKTADSLSIDTVFFKLLPQPNDLQPFSVIVNSIRIGIYTEDQYFVFTNFLMKKDSLYYDPDYGKYNPNYPKAQGYLLTLQPYDSMQLTSFAASGSQTVNYHDCVLRPSDTNRFALIIFQSGSSRDTLTLMGHFINYIAGVKSQMYAPHTKMVNKHSSPKTYNTLGRRVSSGAALPMQLQLLTGKNGNAVPRIIGK